MQEQQLKEINNYKLKDLGRCIADCEKVTEMVESSGWKDIVGPLLDKMIIDVVGGKQNDRWHNGSLDDSRLGEEKMKSLVAYKRALTDFYKYIYQYIDSLDGYKAEYNKIVRDELNPTYTDVVTDYEE